MRRLLFAVVATASLYGCGTRSSDLLKNGDPHVCTKSDVEDQVFEIVKQQLAMQSRPSGGIADYQNKLKGWIDAIQFKLDQITNKDVDKANQKITCAGNIIISASGVPGSITTNIEYEVAADLANDKKVIVSADTLAAELRANTILDALAKPDLDKAAAAQAQEAAVRERQRLATADAQAAVGEQQAAMREEEAGRREELADLRAINFSPADIAAVTQADDLNDKCRGGSGDATDRICAQRDAFYDKLKTQNICWGPSDAIGADQHWMRCH